MFLADIQQAMSQYYNIDSHPRLKRIQSCKYKIKSLIDIANAVVE